MGAQGLDPDHQLQTFLPDGISEEDLYLKIISSARGFIITKSKQ